MNTIPRPVPSNHHPLLSTLITIYTLILLYFPHIFLKALFSPVLLSVALLLLSILKLGATQKQKHYHPEETLETVPKQPESVQILGECEAQLKLETEVTEAQDSRPYYFDPLLEWDMSAPLEVIFEEYGEGEDEDEENDSESRIEEERTQLGKLIDRYPYLSRYYPESDSESDLDSSSGDDGDFPVNISQWDSQEVCVWKEEEKQWGSKQKDEDDLLIEIEISGAASKQEEEEMIEIQGHFEEDNLIEIEIFSRD